MTPAQTLAGLAALAQSTAALAPSPCISVCRMDAGSGLCQGCYRTIDEIIAWGRQSDREHRVVWKKIMHRAGLVPAAAP